MPGLLLCFVLRYDAYKRLQLNSTETGVPPPPNYVQKITYFHCSLIGYFLGKSSCKAFLWISPEGISIYFSYFYMKIHIMGSDYGYLTFTTLWANSADDKLVIFFLFFTENRF